VYEEEMLHRQPGDASSLAAAELPFTQPQALLQEEVSRQQHQHIARTIADAGCAVCAAASPGYALTR
jgi:hypothetical protein